MTTPKEAFAVFMSIHEEVVKDDKFVSSFEDRLASAPSSHRFAAEILAAIRTLELLAEERPLEEGPPPCWGTQ